MRFKINWKKEVGIIFTCLFLAGLPSTKHNLTYPKEMINLKKTKKKCTLNPIYYFRFKKKKEFFFFGGGGILFSRCDFSWEGGGTLPQNSYKPSRDLWESTLLRRTRSDQRLARSFGTNTQTQDKQTSCYFSIRI